MKLRRPETAVGIGLQFLLGIGGVVAALLFFGLPLLAVMTVVAGRAGEFVVPLGSTATTIAVVLSLGVTFVSGIVALVLGPCWLAGLGIRLVERMVLRHTRPTAP